MNEPSDGDLSAWPARPDADLRPLREAGRRALAAMRGWHRADGKDVTMFRGISLGRAWRSELSTPLMGLYRWAVLSKTSSAVGPAQDWDERRYRPRQTTVLRVRREDFKTRCFRLLSRAACALSSNSNGNSALLLASPSNRLLRRAWLKNVAGRALRLDIDMNLPPEPWDALRSLLRGARVFDPSPIDPSPTERLEIESIRSAVARLPQDSAWRAQLTFRGRDLSPWIERLVVAPFLGALDMLARKSLSFEREFDRLKPRLILSPDEVNADNYIFLRLAQDRKVPFWHINHGYPGHGYRFDQNPGCGDLEADLVNAWGPEDRENYLRAGVPPERVAVTGHPAFDELLPLASYRPFRGAWDANVLVAAPITSAHVRAAYYEDTEERFFREVVGLLDYLGARRVVYKLHPGRPRVDFYLGLLDKLRPRCGVEIRHEGGLLNALRSCDWALGGPTTALFETLLSGKDYFFIDYEPCDFPLPFEYDQAFVAKSTAELERNIRDGRSVPRQRIIRDFCGYDGREKPWHASRRILQLAEQRLAATSGVIKNDKVGPTP